MAKVILGLTVMAVYYTGVTYTEKSVVGGLLMEDDTIYVLDKLSAQKLINKGIVVEVPDDLPDAEVSIDGIKVTEIPPLLALSVGAHIVGAKKNEADMAAYKANEDGYKEPEIDGEGLTIKGDTIDVEGEDNTSIDTGISLIDDFDFDTNEEDL